MKVAFALHGNMSIADLKEAARVAEGEGYHSVWLGDGEECDALVGLSACATVTRKLQLGTAVLGVFMRTPTQTALGAAAVDMLSEGRFTLGLGSSHKVQVEEWYGVPYERPIQRVKETVEIIRSLFRGGVTRYEGEIFKIRNFEFLFKPFRSNIPIPLAALNPKMLELAGEIADGVILFQPTTQRLKQSLQHVNKGLAKSGKNLDGFEVATNILTSVDRNSALAKKAVKWYIAWAAGYFPRYNKLLADEGFTQEADFIRRAWLNGDKRAAADAVSDTIVDSTSVAGTPEECKARLDEYRRAGLTLAILLVCPGDRKHKTATIEAMKLLRQ